MSRIISASVLSIAVLVLLAFFKPEFVHVPSLFLTVGGAAGVLCFSFSPRQFRELFAVSRQLLTETHAGLQEFTGELERLTHCYRSEGLRGLETGERGLQDRFLRLAVEMLVDLQKEEKIHADLEREIAEAIGRHEIARQILQSLNKLLPAFGLIGTLVGMVLLLRNIYNQDLQALPGSLSVAVLTTLYGAVLANVLVAPIAARLHAAAAEKEIRMGLVLDWAMSIARGEVVTVNARATAHRQVPDGNSFPRERAWAPLFSATHR